MIAPIRLEPRKIMRARIADRLGLLQYGRIMERVGLTDVSADLDFQRLFNGYYLVRRNAAWRIGYYRLFESMKTEQASFARILQALYENNGDIEASFSSKMLATLHLDQPIWDRFVLQRLGLRLAGKDKPDMLRNAITLYAQIVAWYAWYIHTANAKECLDVFDRTLPDYAWINDVKKIDFFLWSGRPSQ